MKIRIWLAFALLSAYFVGGYLNNTMTNSIGSLTIALVDDHSLIIDDYAPYPNDMSQREGHLYSGMPPGLSFVMVPVYLILKPILALVPAQTLSRADQVIQGNIHAKFRDFDKVSKKRATLALLLIFGVFFLSIPLAIVSGQRFYKTCESVYGPSRLQSIAMLTVFMMFGTMWTDFSATLYHTTLGAVLLWLGFTGLFYPAKPLTNAKVFFLALILGAIGAIDYPAIAYALVVVGGYAFQNRRNLMAVSIAAFGVAIPLALLAIYHTYAFGHPWVTAYQMRAVPFPPDFFLNSHRSGIFRYLPTGANVMRTFFDSKCSVLIYCPMLVFGMIAAGRQFKNTKFALPWLVVGTVLLANLLYFTSLPIGIDVAGGSFGARYTVYSVPFALFALVPYWEKIRLKLGNLGSGMVLLILAIPSTLYLFYGSPNLALGQYLEKMIHQGPAGYTLAKFYEAGWIHSPLFSWIGTGIIGAVCVYLCRQPLRANTYKLPLKSAE